MDPDNLDVEDINSESMEEDYDGGETQLEEDQEINDFGKGKVKTLEKKPPRQRKSTSKVWSLFVKLPRGKDGKLHCKCKMCGKTYRCESCYGTGNMRRHMDNCPKIAHYDLEQMFLSKSTGGSMSAVNRKDPQVFRDMVSCAIVCNDLPFQFVEWTWIRRIIEYLSSDVTLVSRNTAKADVMKMFLREKSKIKTMLEHAPGRICLTCDLWTSINTDGFLCLTAHFIDRNWVLQKRVLNFCVMYPPHDGVSLSQKINTWLHEWGIGNKIFSITLDNASSNKAFVDILKTQMNLHKALVCDGEFLHIRCCAHILNLIVQDGLKEIDEVVLKIRESIRYIKGSQVRKQKFVESVNHVGLDSKMGMRQDVPTRWNSTFLMLQSALYYRRVWCALEMLDSNYKHCPSPTEWEKVEKIATFLQHFYDVTCSFSGSKYPTSNLYFPNVLSTYLLLKKNLESSDVFMKNMATKMYSKYDKYWGDFSVILAIALVLDPRYKMTFVEFAYKKVYGSESVELDNVRNKLFSLFNEYMMHSTRSTRRVTSNSLPSGSGSHESENITTSSMNATISSLDLLEEYESFERYEDTSLLNKKTQLELYLDEPKVEKTMKLDILNFWRGNEVRFPELSMMARDRSIPF
ncbi:hypothetical protein Q3G72_029823 [Acer saccharum]|nr:hypothetical protein Q3G72_029823 [Acer saccharum]